MVEEGDEFIKMKLQRSNERDQQVTFDITNVTNKFGKPLDLVVRHSNNKCKILSIKEQETQIILTDRGNVTVSVFDPEDPVFSEIPLESKTIPSNKNVTLERDVKGVLRIRRSLSLIKLESRKRAHAKHALH
ncbi:uncharacterized protein LOC132748332 [Ruditapes philippinarum]|uniref:uncharacterized protein LOC132748332 n=1 Tax=Ruditapes philippinarum TaxID=129788 RepID=UPI00295C160D|nr:uncharacterized protein LOC132748332 [Ruditapes philippinarum]